MAASRRSRNLEAHPGNKVRVNCSNENPQWASVSYGIFSYFSAREKQFELWMFCQRSQRTMDSNSTKSRKERRKEARADKKTMQFKSWMSNQKSTKKHPTSATPSFSGSSRKRKFRSQSPCLENDQNVSMSMNSRETIHFDRVKRSGSGDKTNATKVRRRQNEAGDHRKSKTKFEEYLEMEMHKGAVSSTDDVKMEGKLAKKLKLRSGKLAGPDDGLNELFDYVSEVAGYHPPVQSLGFASPNLENLEKEIDVSSESLSSDNESDRIETSGDFERDINENSTEDACEFSTEEHVVAFNESNDIKDVEATSMTDGRKHHKVQYDDSLSSKPSEKVMKYVAPHLRSHSENESEDLSQVRRQMKGLLNRLSESNVETITKEISLIVQSVGRNKGTQMVTDDVLASCSTGPRCNEQYAAVFAAFIAGMASSVGIDFGAKFIASLAMFFEEEYRNQDGLSLRNLALLLSQLFIFGLCSSDLIYDVLSCLSKRMMELDVSTILAILQCCGMKLRGDDPTSMKFFIISVQQKVQELKTSEGAPNGQPSIGKRMDFMLETICDIKNNKKRPKEDAPHHVRLKKWLQKLRVEEIELKGLKWSKLLDPNKKGQWWLSGELTSIEDTATEIADKIDTEALEAQKLLQLAAAQRMNTEARRAIFCVIMSGEDYMDAFEKILRLDLQGTQDREIMRVLVECCLQEKVFNKYYTVLASKLCSYNKNHKFTLQYCLWDHFKQLDSMELRRSANLARFVAEMLVSFSLSLALLKVVEFNNPKLLTPKRVMHFRLLFESLLAYSDEQVWNMFTRIANVPELEPLHEGLQYFLKRYIIGMASTETRLSVARKFKIARKALKNVAGILK